VAKQVTIAVVRRPILRSLVVTLAWLGVSIAFVHLFLNATRPRSLAFLGLFAAAAVVALVLAWVSGFGPADRLRPVSGIAAGLTALVALGLIALGAAHETGLGLILGAAVIAVVSMMPAGTSDK